MQCVKVLIHITLQSLENKMGGIRSFFKKVCNQVECLGTLYIPSTVEKKICGMTVQKCAAS